MTNFPIHTMESAPEGSKPALQTLQSAFGMLPNIAGAVATSPVLINSLVGLFGNVHGGSFTEPQIQTVLLTDAVTNASAWAVAFHTALALKEGIEPADVAAIRDGGLPKEPDRRAEDVEAFEDEDDEGHFLHQCLSSSIVKRGVYSILSTERAIPAQARTPANPANGLVVAQSFRMS